MSRSSLSFPQAMDIAAATINNLVKVNQEASICVVDAAGQPLVQLMMDGARPFTSSIALKKAQLAAHTGYTTRHMRDGFKEPESGMTPALYGITKENEVPWAGGVPIYAPGGKTLMGGIGVSNLSEDEDEKHAIIGVAVSGFGHERS